MWNCTLLDKLAADNGTCQFNFFYNELVNSLMKNCYWPLWSLSGNQRNCLMRAALCVPLGHKDLIVHIVVFFGGCFKNKVHSDIAQHGAATWSIFVVAFMMPKHKASKTRQHGSIQPCSANTAFNLISEAMADNFHPSDRDVVALDCSPSSVAKGSWNDGHRNCIWTSCCMLNNGDHCCAFQQLQLSLDEL